MNVPINKRIKEEKLKYAGKTQGEGLIGSMKTKKDNPMNTDTKNIIVDLVNKIKYEVTDEQMAELSGSATPLDEAEFVDWRAKIDDLDLSAGGHGRFSAEMAAQLREVLHRILQATHKIGGKAVKIGRRIIKWIFSMLERFPRTAKMLVIMAALTFLVAQIPVLHYILLPIVQIAGVLIVGNVFLSETVVNVGEYMRNFCG
jgi:hypothetical protein